MQQEMARTLTANVVSKSGDKSIKATIAYKIKHPKYGKYIKQRKVLKVHDEHNKAQIGDLIKISPSRPYSKTKSWRLVEIVEKAMQA